MKKDNNTLTRRDFFKAGTILAGGVTVTAALAPYDGLLFAAEAPNAKGIWYGIGIDINKQNAFNFYKDKLRTFEILARQRMNKGPGAAWQSRSRRAKPVKLG